MVSSPSSLSHDLNKGARVMQPTVEVRWFYEGGIPETTSQRFRSGELPQNKRTIEERKDLYLYLPGVDSLGIKLRGTNKRRENDADQLEIKRRQLEGGVVTFIPGVTGRMERWMKWVFHGESVDPQLSSILTTKDEAWFSVSKVRYLRKYKVTSDKRVLALPLSEGQKLPQHFLKRGKGWLDWIGS
jgi:hypothetical protein